MRRSNLIKGVICGLMLTTVLGSVAYAKTDTYSKYVGINGNGRNLWDEEFYDYRGTAKAYINTFVYAGLSDNYTWTFYPRYN